MYCVIVGDMITSRAMDQAARNAVLKAANAEFERINAEYHNEVLARFGMVRGDAFEGVLFALCPAPEIVRRIIRAFAEAGDARVRIAVVYGELTVTSKNRNEADGPAFQAAFARIEQMKKAKSEHWLQVAMQVGGTAQPLIDGLLGLLCALTEGWTSRQRQIAWEMDALSGLQKLVGEKLGLVPSTVSRQLKSAHYAAYANAWGGLAAYLQSHEQQALEVQTHGERDKRE